MIAGLFTAALLALFIGGWIWAWSPKRKKSFDDAARLPLDDQEPVADENGDRNKEQSP